MGIKSMCYATMAAGIGCLDDRLTDEEKDELVEAVGGAHVVRQIRRGERAVKAMLINPLHGTILKDSSGEDLMREVDDYLIELPPVKNFVVRRELAKNRDGEITIASISGIEVEDFLGIEENDVPAVVLRQRAMLKRSADEHVLLSLGNDLTRIEKSMVAAAHIRPFIGNKIDALERIFFVLGKSGNPLSVHTWHDDGLCIEVCPIPHERSVEPGDHIVTPITT